MSKKIVLVEDDVMLQEMYQTKLKNEGFEVFLAENGDVGYKIICEQMPDLVLLDIMMPILDGFAVLEMLKKNPATKDIKVIMMTNLSTDEDRKKGESMGATDYLVKANMTPEQVNDVVKKNLA